MKKLIRCEFKPRPDVVVSVILLLDLPGQGRPCVIQPIFIPFFIINIHFSHKNPLQLFYTVL